jgi:hypothetical protein
MNGVDISYLSRDINQLVPNNYDMPFYGIESLFKTSIE